MRTLRKGIAGRIAAMGLVLGMAVLAVLPAGAVTFAGPVYEAAPCVDIQIRQEGTMVPAQLEAVLMVRDQQAGIASVFYSIEADGQGWNYQIPVCAAGEHETSPDPSAGYENVQPGLLEEWNVLEAEGDVIHCMSRTVYVYAQYNAVIRLAFTDRLGNLYSFQKDYVVEGTEWDTQPVPEALPEEPEASMPEELSEGLPEDAAVQDAPGELSEELPEELPEDAMFQEIPEDDLTQEMAEELPEDALLQEIPEDALMQEMAEALPDDSVVQELSGDVALQELPEGDASQDVAEGQPEELTEGEGSEATADGAVSEELLEEASLQDVAEELPEVEGPEATADGAVSEELPEEASLQDMAEGQLEAMPEVEGPEAAVDGAVSEELPEEAGVQDPEEAELLNAAENQEQEAANDGAVPEELPEPEPAQELPQETVPAEPSADGEAAVSEDLSAVVTEEPSVPSETQTWSSYSGTPSYYYPQPSYSTSPVRNTSSYAASGGGGSYARSTRSTSLTRTEPAAQDETEGADSDTKEDEKPAENAAGETDETAAVNPDQTGETNQDPAMEGSVYDLSAIEKYNGKYLKDVEDLVIYESNAEKLLSESVQVLVSRNNEMMELEKGVDYDFKLTGSSAGQKIYKYTIKKNAFREDGTYRIYLSSEDEKGHKNSSESQNAGIWFYIDNVSPLILSVESTQEQETKGVREIRIKDDTQLSDIEIYLGDQKVNFEEDGETYRFPVSESNEAADVKVVAKDRAGNTYERVLTNYVHAGKANVRAGVSPLPLIFLAAAGILTGVLVFRKRRHTHRTRRAR